MLIDLAFLGTAAVSMRSALKYRRNWDKNGPTVQLLRKFMPRGSKGFRVYVPIGHAQVTNNVVIPLPVRLAVRKAGFRITDYRAKRCVKLNDKDQKNVFNIGKVISKDAVAKAAFDNDPQLQNSSTSEFTMVISCHPYDIIGMSTGRDWDETSCMRMGDYRDDYSDGSNVSYLKHDVAEGTLVVYAVRSDDTNITKPLGRCLLKPFLRDDGSGSIFYRRETDVYGNPVPGLAETLARFLRKLNAGVPAGIYKLNEKLYNDGLVPRAENDGSSEGPTVDWAVVDDQQKLKERPEMFADFANYLMKRNAEGITDTSVVINILIDHAKTINARFVKPAARVIANPKFAAAFLEHAASSFSDSDSDSIAKFMASPEFRRALLRAEREAEEAPDTYRSLSFLSPKNAHRYFVREVKDNPDNYNYAAISYACGTVDLLPDDVESIPELHKLVFKYAELIRESSVFGSTAYQESAHRVLSTVEPYKGEYTRAEIEDIAATLAGDKQTYRAIMAWYINSSTANDRMTSDFLADFIKEVRFRWALRDRRMRKRILGLKNISDNARRMITNAIVELMDNHEAQDAASIQRDVIAHIRRTGFDCLTAGNYLSILGNAPQLFKSLWYSEGNEIGAEMVEALLARPSMLSERIRENPDAVPQNDFQQNIFRVAKTFVVVIGNPTEQDKEIGAVDPDVMRVLVKFGGAMRALGHFIINLADYPELLNGSTYVGAGIFPLDLIGEDNGHKFLDSLREKDIDATQTLLKAVAHDFAQMGLYAGAATRQNRVLSNAGAPSGIATMAKSPPEFAVAAQGRYVAAIQKVNSFIENFPVSGTIEDWEKLLPQMDMEHLPAFNEMVDGMLDNQRQVQQTAQMFAMFAQGETKEALKAALPPEWLTIKDL
jgi:hypothetical protein